VLKELKPGAEWKDSGGRKKRLALLLPKGHKPLQPGKILPVKPVLQRLLTRRNDALRIGTKLVAIEAVGGALPRVVTVDLACTRFRRHRVRCFDGTGGVSWRDGSLHGSSSLRRFG
jgi:hypothetical protein